MRLINAKTLALEQFFDREVPKYAILSHTWGDAEVGFEEFLDISRASSRNPRNYEKISFVKKQTLQDGLQYFWVDTCCIDKSNTAELSEAINSMFSWYHNAEVCYAYLSDVVQRKQEKQPSLEFLHPQISQSRWFSRGWTLQELIAPPCVKFFGYPWTPLGSKEDLMSTISQVTKIPKNVLLDSNNTFDFSVAQRMSWAAERKTRRSEDMAYCLLGLFDVNMPILYGEGNRAFLRLQEEIMRKTMDLSIFAWQGRAAQRLQVGGTLGGSPEVFLGCGKITFEPKRMETLCIKRRKRVMLQLPTLHWETHSKDEEGLFTTALLPCQYWDEPGTILGLPLIRHDHKQPWKRIWGGHQGLVKVAMNQVENAPIHTIELDIGMTSTSAVEEGNYLEYFGNLILSRVIQDDWITTTQNEMQTIWNSVMRKAMNDLQITANESEHTLVAFKISFYDAKCGTKSAILQRHLTEPWGSVGTTSTQQQGIGRLAIHMRPTSMDASEANSDIQSAEGFKGAHAHSQHGQHDYGLDQNITYPQKEPFDTINERLVLSPDSYGGDDFSHSWEKLEVDSARHWPENTESLAWPSIPTTLTSESVNLEKEAKDTSIGRDQEVESDCESSISDVEFDDISSTTSTTSSTDEDTSVLDVLVDVLVDIITEKGGISSALFDDAKSIEIESRPSGWTKEAFKRGNETSSSRGRKRKADTEDDNVVEDEFMTSHWRDTYRKEPHRACHLT